MTQLTTAAISVAVMAPSLAKGFSLSCFQPVARQLALVENHPFIGVVEHAEVAVTTAVAPPDARHY